MTRQKITKTANAAVIGLEVYTRRTVDRPDRHLVRLRASALNGCRYCTAMHRGEARKDGWSDERIDQVEQWTDHPEAFDARQRAILALTDAVTRIDGEESVPDELWTEVTTALGDDGAGHLLMEIVTINAWNRIAITTRLEPPTA